jgi:hypothetical protein
MKEAFNKENIFKLQKELGDAFKELIKKHGLTLMGNRVRYGSDEFTIKFRVYNPGKNGESTQDNIHPEEVKVGMKVKVRPGVRIPPRFDFLNSDELTVMKVLRSRVLVGDPKNERRVKVPMTMLIPKGGK